MLTGGNRTHTWDYDNRLSSVTVSGSTTSMVYDYTGMRTEKSGPLGTTIFPFSGYEIGPGGISVKYIRIGIENVASKKSTGETLFYHNDHLGGVNVITNTSGLLAQLIEYDPWGKVSRSEGGGDSLRRFTGKILDPESGLYYYGGRYYDPELGRFISPDPFVPQPDDPQSLNRYSYVLNNPQNYIDPSGYSFFSKLFKKIKKFFKKVFKAIFSNPVVKIITGIALIATGFGAETGGFFFATAGLRFIREGVQDLVGPGGGTGPPGGGDFGSPSPFGFAFAGAAPGNGFSSPALVRMEVFAGSAQQDPFQRLLSESTVKEGFRRALNEQARTGIEQGGKILQNKITGSISLQTTSDPTLSTQTRVVIKDPSRLTSFFNDVIGEFHTHPLGPLFGRGPNPGDINTFLGCPVSRCGSVHFIIDNEDIFGINRSGQGSRIGRTIDIIGR